VAGLPPRIAPTVGEDPQSVAGTKLTNGACWAMGVITGRGLCPVGPWDRPVAPCLQSVILAGQVGVQPCVVGDSAIAPPNPESMVNIAARGGSVATRPIRTGLWVACSPSSQNAGAGPSALRHLRATPGQLGGTPDGTRGARANPAGMSLD